MHPPRILPLVLLLALASSCTGIPGTHCHELGRARAELDGLLAEMAEAASGGPIAEGDPLDLAAGDLLAELTALARKDGDPALTSAVREAGRAYDDFDRRAFRARLAVAWSAFDAKIREDCVGDRAPGPGPAPEPAGEDRRDRGTGSPEGKR